ncbi:MAG: hypothetical protein ABR587_06055 [Candidatus Binatia bacterium]
MMRIRPTFLRGAAVMLSVSVLSGCSFSWGSGGISDVLFGGRQAEDIVQGEEPAKGSAEEKAAAAAKAEEELLGEESNLRRLAILPVAYSDGTAGQPCDLCPPSVAMKPTSALAARLATGFTYEAIARHPRFLFPAPDAVERAVAATPNRSLRQAALQLAADGRAELVAVLALVELRPRIGPDDAPSQPAGATVYAALVNAKSGETLWSDTFDRNESGRGFILKTYDKVANDQPIRYRTAEGYMEHAVDELIEDLVDEVD